MVNIMELEKILEWH